MNAGSWHSSAGALDPHASLQDEETSGSSGRGGALYHPRSRSKASACRFARFPELSWAPRCPIGAHLRRSGPSDGPAARNFRGPRYLHPVSRTHTLRPARRPAMNGRKTGSKRGLWPFAGPQLRRAAADAGRERRAANERGATADAPSRCNARHTTRSRHGPTRPPWEGHAGLGERERSRTSGPR